jgi:transposase
MGKSIRNLSTVTRVGLDLAKRVFKVHAVDAKGEIVVARKLTRSQLIPFFAELPPSHKRNLAFAGRRGKAVSGRQILPAERTI